MDKYHCKLQIVSPHGEDHNWIMVSHTGVVTAKGLGYDNWHNAKRAMDRHITLIQSGNFALPQKPARKKYTFKSNKEKTR